MGLPQQEPILTTTRDGVFSLDPDTIPTILDLIRDQPAREFFLSPMSLDLSVQDLQTAAEDDNSFVMGVFVNGVLTSFSVGHRHLSSTEEKHEGVITHLFVRKDYRGLGYGVALCEEVLGTLRALNCFSTMAHTPYKKREDIPTSTLDACSRFDLFAPMGDAFEGVLRRGNPSRIPS